jgi:ubiquinone/menaquinone biosynthesis C-methylase UbiE
MQTDRRSGKCKRSGAIGAAAALAVVLGGAIWWRRNPSACPYSQRFWVQAPHPFITRERLHRVLEPQAGERVLEVGPGTGYYALPVAQWLAPGGQLDIFDIQQEMLDHTLRRADQAGLTNLNATQGDAQQLPYDDATFDRAYLVTVLGEIPDQDAALRELRRVLKPGGRLVVGEIVVDPHFVTSGSLRRRATRAGLDHERTCGSLIGHFTALRRPDPDS